MFINTHFPIMQAAVLAMALAMFGASHPTPLATNQITYGTLDNFDVINDTGGECHGFEIELEGISAADVAYTFGAPYQRYGDPTVLPNLAGTGVIIRYAATFSASSWSATTPVATQPYLPTQGHSCWTGGVANAAEYYAAGCDHFGASLNKNPTKTTYRWLVESAPGSGILMPFGGSPPAVPAPVWKVDPPMVPGGQPVAAAVIAPPPRDPSSQFMFGEALWVKVYKTELQDPVNASDLDHMVIDDPNGVNIVPNERAEIETEWFLLQASTNSNGEVQFGAEVGAGNEVVSRRFEFYKYAGQYDTETHEALCDNPFAPDQQIPSRCGSPNADGVAGVGDLTGAQNAAINLNGPVVVVPENHAPVAYDDTATTAEDVALTISTATLVSNDTDRDLDPLTVVSVQDPINGGVELVGSSVVFTPTPDHNGAASFTYTVSDGLGGTAMATVKVSVTPVNDPPVANAGANQSVLWHTTVLLNGSLTSDVDHDSLTYRWTFVQLPPKSKATFSGGGTVNPTFKTDKEGTYVIQLIVNDGTVDSNASTLTVTATKK